MGYYKILMILLVVLCSVEGVFKLTSKVAKAKHHLEVVVSLEKKESFKFKFVAPLNSTLEMRLSGAGKILKKIR